MPVTPPPVAVRPPVVAPVIRARANDHWHGKRDPDAHSNEGLSLGSGKQSQADQRCHDQQKFLHTLINTPDQQWLRAAIKRKDSAACKASRSRATLDFAASVSSLTVFRRACPARTRPSGPGLPDGACHGTRFDLVPVKRGQAALSRACGSLKIGFRCIVGRCRAKYTQKRTGWTGQPDAHRGKRLHSPTGSNIADDTR